MSFKGIKPVSLEGIRKARNRIYRIGVELEGGWDVVPDNIPLVHDGSVQFEGLAKYPNKQGELPSPPLEPEVYEAWVRKFYPQYVNATCGMHVHLSFKSALTYQRLMDPRYPATILAQFEKWGKKVKLHENHPLWPRLEGKSVYCKHQFSADDQVMTIDKDHNRERKGNRYTLINYCWSRTQTLECRLLPAMADVETAISAINEFIEATNAYLVATAKREAKVRGEMIIPKETYEQRNIRLRR